MTTNARTRRGLRLAGMLGACALAVAALTGCIKVDADLSIDSDAKGTGTLAMELQKDAASFLGISDLDSFSAQMTSGELTQESGLESLDDCTTSETDTGFAYTCTFTAADFTAAGDGPWTITKDGSSIAFRMENDGQSADEAGQSMDLLGDASMGSIQVDVTFPGPITSITGAGAEKTSDTTATITASMTDTLDVAITSDASTGGLPWSVILVVLVGLAVLLLIVIVAVVLISRRRSGGEAAVATGAATTEAATTDLPTTEAATTDLPPTENSNTDVPPTEEPNP